MAAKGSPAVAVTSGRLPMLKEFALAAAVDVAVAVAVASFVVVVVAVVIAVVVGWILAVRAEAVLA